MTAQDIVPFLDLKAQHALLKERLVAAFAAAVDGATFIGGAEVEGFEAEFAGFCQSPLCVSVGSGTDALRFALIAMGIGPGDTVITVPNTFIATTEAISQTGASFEFVDIDPATKLMNMSLLAQALEQRASCGQPMPKAVVPVHLYGQCAEMDELMDLSGRYGFKVLEDAAQAHGASYKVRRAGTLGHAAAFSFYPGKNLGACGEAGAVTTGDAELAKRVRMLRDHGQSEKYKHVLEGYNGRLDAIQAAALRIKLPYLEGWNARRREIADRYDAAFADLPWLKPVVIAPHNVPSRHLYVVNVDGNEALAAHLAAQGIHTAYHYPVPLHLQACYSHLGLERGSFPVAEQSASQLLSLPLFPELTTVQQDRVVTAVRSFRSA